MEATTGGREGWKVRKEGSDDVRERRVERRCGGDDGKGGKEETEAWRRGRRGMERWQEGVEAMTGGKEEGKGSRYGRDDGREGRKDGTKVWKRRREGG